MTDWTQGLNPYEVCARDYAGPFTETLIIENDSTTVGGLMKDFVRKGRHIVALTDAEFYEYMDMKQRREDARAASTWKE